MNEPCGCCSGVEIITPMAETNPPGLTAIAYRAGTYATFYETMLARLSGLSIDVPSAGGSGTDRIYPLAQLTTRDPSDPAIALLDAWAIVADVLTFYQERIANEGYLPTAIERRSILELARLVGYRARPGVSASVYLAFTASAAFKGDIPAGTRAQSIPGAGERPQFFETSDVLTARDVWNNLKPRRTRPQVITPADVIAGAVLPTDVGFVDAVYLDGLSTNLKTGDALLFVLGKGRGQPILRTVETITAQAEEKRSEIILVQSASADALLLYEATALFACSGLAQEVVGILNDLIKGSSDGNGPRPVALALSSNQDPLHYAIEQIEQKRNIAAKRNLTRLTVWIDRVLRLLRSLVASLGPINPAPVLSPLANLAAVTSLLAKPGSLQPRNAIRLERSPALSFSLQSDTAPRVIAALHPAAAATLYQAWTNIAATAGGIEVLAPRVRATLFASNFAGPATVASGNVSFNTPLSISNTWKSLVSAANAAPTAVALDTTYDHIKPGSWVAIDRPALDGDGRPTGHRAISYHTVQAVRSSNMDTTMGFTAKVTLLTVHPPWLADSDPTLPLGATAVLRDTVVYAQCEPLQLVEEPLDCDVAGDTIVLDEVYDGLEPGRWIIVSGNRVDVPNVSAVSASELVMIAGVSQADPDIEAWLAAVEAWLAGLPGVVNTTAEQIRTTLLAWRATPPKLRTILKLANKLAYTYDAASVTIYGNVAEATHGQTVGEVLGDGDSSKPFQNFALRQSPLTYLSAPTPSGAVSTLVARVNDIEWHEAENLVEAGPRDRVYVTRTDDGDQTTLTFGNGQHGARVPTGIANLKAVYRYGIGKAGNAAARQISQLATHPLGLDGVINPLRASGGADRDSADQARRNTPLAVKALDRLVSVPDYADFARTYAGIAKASSARLSDGRRTIVHVTVAGVDDIPIDRNSDLYRNLLTSLETFGDPHLPVQVCVRQVKLLVISAGVRILPDYEWDSVEPKVRAALLDYFNFDARDLEQTAFLSETVRVMQGVEGVAYVDVQVFDSISEDLSAEQLAALGTTLSLNQHVLADRARLNPSPDAAADDPCAQVLPAELVFITPGLPDTLILNRIGG